MVCVLFILFRFKSLNFLASSQNLSYNEQRYLAERMCRPGTMEYYEF